MSDLVEKLRTLCSGHPHAKVPWPHRDIHDAITEIERLQRVEKATIKALKLHVKYEKIPRDRGGKSGPKGKAWTAFIKARDAALSSR